MINIVSSDFNSKLSEPALIPFSANISKRITDQPEFSSLKERGQALQLKVELFANAMQAAADGSRTKLAEKNMCKKELLKQLEETAAHVNALANGNEALVLMSGFNIRRKPVQQREGDLSQVTRVQGRPGKQPGEVILEFDAVPNARIYAAEWSADNGETWHNGFYPTSRRAVLQGLPVRQDLLFRVCAIGSGQRKGQHSDPLRLFVA